MHLLNDVYAKKKKKKKEKRHCVTSQKHDRYKHYKNSSTKVALSNIQCIYEIKIQNSEFELFHFCFLQILRCAGAVGSTGLAQNVKKRLSGHAARRQGWSGKQRCDTRKWALFHLEVARHQSPFLCLLPPPGIVWWDAARTERIELPGRVAPMVKC